MRKVTFLICLLVLFPLTLNAQPPKPRRATETTAAYLKLTSFVREFGPGTNLRFSSDGQTVFIAGLNGPVIFPTPYPNTHINLRETKSVKEVLGEERIRDYVLSPDLQKILIRRYDERKLVTSELWNPHTAKHIGNIGARRGDFSPDGHMLVAADSTSRSEIVALWNSHTAKRMRSITIPKDDTARALRLVYYNGQLSESGVIFSPDGQMFGMAFDADIATGKRRYIIELWNPHNGKHMRRITDPTRGAMWCTVRSVVFTPDGRILAVSVERGTGSFTFRSEQERIEKTAKYTKNSIELWDLHDGRHITNLEPPAAYNRPISIVFSPAGRLLAGAVKGSSTILVWNLRTGEHISTLQTNQSVYHVGRAPVFSPKGQTLAAFNGADRIQLWNPQTGEVIGILEHGLEAKDLKRIPAVVENSPDVAEARDDLSLSNVEITNFTFNPNGRTAAAIAQIGALGIPVFWEIPEEIDGGVVSP